MANLSPYRSLPAARRVALVAHTIEHHKDARVRFAQRIAAKGGGFRAAAVQGWPLERLSREVVRLNAESSTDELELLQLLYVEIEPAIQILFLETAGVPHEQGVIEESLEPPFASADAVGAGARAVSAQFGEDGMRYLRALIRYSSNAWPDIAEHVANLSTLSSE